mmetsp:Transcript_46144/g.90950  ORF Transcript_46144/g.90950 Transcript_46144/m.90950 type:complete len:291 (+) Transcript_46144:162-1034(+)
MQPSHSGQRRCGITDWALGLLPSCRMMGRSSAARPIETPKACMSLWSRISIGSGLKQSIASGKRAGSICGCLCVFRGGARPLINKSAATVTGSSCSVSIVVPAFASPLASSTGTATGIVVGGQAEEEEEDEEAEDEGIEEERPTPTSRESHGNSGYHSPTDTDTSEETKEREAEAEADEEEEEASTPSAPLTRSPSPPLSVCPEPKTAEPAGRSPEEPFPSCPFAPSPSTTTLSASRPSSLCLPSNAGFPVSVSLLVFAALVGASPTVRCPSGFWSLSPSPSPWRETEIR